MSGTWERAWVLYVWAECGERGRNSGNLKIKGGLYLQMGSTGFDTILLSSSCDAQWVCDYQGNVAVCYST